MAIFIENIALHRRKYTEIVSCTACVAGDNKDGTRHEALFHIELGEEHRPRSSFDLCMNHSTKLRKILSAFEKFGAANREQADKRNIK